MNGDFESFVGVFPDGITASNGAITTNSATWNIWRTWDRYQSVNDLTLIEPTSGVVPFPDGWGGNNFAEHSQALTPSASDDGDYTDQIKQGIDGSKVVPGVPVTLSFKHINAQPGRETIVTVYGIDAGQSWSEFASWPCVGCTLLYSATITTPWAGSPGWQTFSGSFTPLASHAVVAVGITQGGYLGYARGVDDVVLSQNRPPDCSAAAPSLTTLWSPNHQMVPINILGVTDPDGDAVTINVTGIRQDEPVNALGDGSTGPDASGVGTATALLRAERAGGGNGRVYHGAFTADDGNGGSCSGAVRVGVPNSQGSKGMPIDGGPLYDSTAPQSTWQSRAGCNIAMRPNAIGQVDGRVGAWRVVCKSMAVD